MPLKAAHLPGRAVLALEGEDRFAFLQGLVSNDMAQAEQGHPLFTALLTPQGKYLFDFIIVPENGRLLLDCDAVRAEELTRKLLQFRLRARISIAPVPLNVYAFWNESGEGSLSSTALPGAFADPRLKALGLRLLAQQPPAMALNATAEDYRVHRLTLGVPEGGHEIEPGGTTLYEPNFDLLNGISFSKGCYMGQELTARMHYRALIKKRMLPFSYKGEAPAAGTALAAAGEEFGTVIAAAGGAGIGLFPLEKARTFLATPPQGASFSLHVPDYLAAAFS